MISKTYQEMSLKERSDYMAKVIILAESSASFEWFQKRVQEAEEVGFFELVAPGDASHPEVRDLDSPIENGPGSPQN